MYTEENAIGILQFKVVEKTTLSHVHLFSLS